MIRRRTNFMKKLIVISLGLILMIGSQAIAQNVITVNGTPVTVKEFADKLEQVPVESDKPYIRTAGDLVVHQLINEMLIRQFAKEQGLEPTPQQISKKIEFMKSQNPEDFDAMLKAQGLTIDNLKEKIKTEQSFVNVITKGVEVTDEEVKKTYDDMLAKENSPFKQPEMRFISAIITSTKDRADVAYKALQDGQEFSATAIKISEHSSKNQGGEFAWVTQANENIPEEIREHTFELAENKYSEPFEIQGDYWILKVNKVLPAKTTSYETVKDTLREQIAINKGMEKGAAQDDLKEFVKRANITVANEVYSEIVNKIKSKADSGDLPITPDAQ